MRKDTDVFPEIVNAFEKEHPEYKVEITEFDDINDMRMRLATELMAGKGPDVIFCYPMPFLNPEKTIQSGYLLDLTPYLDQNPDFMMEDYFSQAMEAVIMDGKRYLAPLDFSYWPVYTTKSVLARIGAKPGDSLSVERLSGLVKDQTTPLVYTNLKHIVENYTKEYEVLYRYWSSMGISIADTEKEKPLFDQTPFQKAVEFLKMLCESQGAIDMKTNPAEQTNESSVMLWDPLNPYSSNDLFRWEKGMKARGEQGVLLAPPSAEGSVGSGIIHNALAVNAGAKEKDGAIALVQFALGEEMQTKGASNWLLVPVNKKALEGQIQYFLDTEFEDIGVSEEYIACYRELVENSGPCLLFDPELGSMVDEMVVKYIKDEITLEQMTKELMQRVGLYLKE